jgi:hypothetical protein
MAAEAGAQVLSYGQLKAIWLDASKGTRYHTNTWASLMAAIAEAESSGNPGAVNPDDNNGTQTSWGLWQISNGTHSSVSDDWADPYENAKLAIGKLEGPDGLSAWGTYDSGAYKAYLSDKTSPDYTGIAPGSVASTAAATAQATAQSDCLVGGGSIGLGLSMPCLLSRSEARALIGAGVIVGGLALVILGTGFLAKVVGLEAVAGPALKALGPIASAASRLPGLPPP